MGTDAAVNINADDYLRGQRDCKDGIPQRAGQSPSYNRGYAAQYEWEQVMTELSLRKERDE